jgi:hypothetical protein
MNVDTDTIFNCQLDSDDVEEAFASGRIDQKIKVAAFKVVAVEGGAEQARVGHAGFEDYAADRVAVLGESF